ncbi:hypothetical protein IJ732_07545, partial [bacterium]|nr:hypothetical protein [bacterium]
QCENGYQNNGTSCRDIRENTCATYSGTTCTKCTTENLLVDNECVSKTSLHCQTSNGVSCTECNSDYHDENGTCAKGYVENCSVYDGEKCQTCNSSDLAVSYKNECINGKVETNEDGETLNMYPLGDYYISESVSYSSLTPRTDTDFVTQGNQWNENNDRWAAADDYCKSFGMSLPTNDQLIEIYNNSSKNDVVPTSGYGWYWTKQDYILNDKSNGVKDVALTVNLITGEHTNGMAKYGAANIMCISSQN